MHCKCVGLIVVSISHRHGKDIKHDLKLLLDGVTDFNLNYESVPSALLVHGPLAFPIVLGSLWEGPDCGAVPREPAQPPTTEEIRP